MGELNSKLLGMIFVMKFQAAAMGRAYVAEEDRKDFSLFVDEFQNFATESFETILSEARKYRLNLVLGNQFMTQLTDKIREAIIGNVGTVISGRIGVTDAELMVKKFQPVFDAEDLTKLPNYQSIVSVMINGVPSAPFSMSLLPPMNQANPQLADAMKRLSATKYGHSRAKIEKEIFKRLEPPKPAIPPSAGPGRPSGPGGPRPMASGPPAPGGGAGGSFLDEWLAKRQNLATQPQRPAQDPSMPPSQQFAINPAQQRPGVPVVSTPPLSMSAQQQNSDTMTLPSQTASAVPDQASTQQQPAPLPVPTTPQTLSVSVNPSQPMPSDTKPTEDTVPDPKEVHIRLR